MLHVYIMKISHFEYVPGTIRICLSLICIFILLSLSIILSVCRVVMHTIDRRSTTYVIYIRTVISQTEQLMIQL